MTPLAFRRIALRQPEAVEAGHMGHPDFRVGGKIFATHFDRDGLRWGMVKLKPEQQRPFIEEFPGTFEPVAGGWGRKGATAVRLAAADPKAVALAMRVAWGNVASKRLRESD